MKSNNKSMFFRFILLTMAMRCPHHIIINNVSMDLVRSGAVRVRHRHNQKSLHETPHRASVQTLCMQLGYIFGDYSARRSPPPKTLTFRELKSLLLIFPHKETGIDGVYVRCVVRMNIIIYLISFCILSSVRLPSSSRRDNAYRRCPD